MKNVRLSRLRASRPLLFARPPARRPTLEPQTLRVRPVPPAPRPPERAR